MKQRHPVVVVILTIVTFGIYFIYWLYDIVRTINPKLSSDKQAWSMWWLASPLVVMVSSLTFFALLTAVDLGGGVQTFFQIVIFLAGALGVLGLIIVPFMWFYRFCQALEAYSQGQIKFQENYLIFVLLYIFSLPMIWQGITQNELNQLSANKATDQPNQQADSEPSPE